MPDHLRNWKERTITFDPYAKDELGVPRILYKLDAGKKIVMAAAGELMVITGNQKSRKTLLASCIMMSNYTDDVNKTLNFETNFEGRPIVFYDTEQPFHRTRKNFNRFHALCELESHAKDLHVFNIKSFSPFDMTEFITHTLDEVMQEHGTEPALVVIDQIADLTRGGDVNDTESMDRIYTHLCRWDEMCNSQALIMPVIHTNRGGKDTDGKLGRMLDKKCDCQLSTSLVGDNFVTEVRHKEARTVRIPNFRFRQNFEGDPQFINADQFGF